MLNIINMILLTGNFSTKPRTKQEVTSLFIIASIAKWIPLFQYKLWTSLACLSFMSSSQMPQGVVQHGIIFSPLWWAFSTGCVCIHTTAINYGNYLYLTYLISTLVGIPIFLSIKCLKHCWMDEIILRHHEISNSIGKVHGHIGQKWISCWTQSQRSNSYYSFVK